MSVRGEELRRLRQRAGLTQEALAERAEVSVSTIRKLEQGERPSAYIATLRRLAGALGTTTAALLEPLPQLTGQVDEGERYDLLGLRQVLQPAHGAGQPLIDDHGPLADDDLRELSWAAHGLFRDGDYDGAFATLPATIGQVRAATQLLDGGQREAAARHLVQVLQTAAMVLIMASKHDLAWTALAEAYRAAELAGDPVGAAGIACTEGWLLTTQARFADASTAGMATAAALEPPMSADPAHLAVWGWLELSIAAAAARNAQQDEAAEAIRRAYAVGHLVEPHQPRREVAHWSTFGPTTVAMREAEIAAVAGDAGAVLRVAGRVPANARPAVTWQRHRLDVAAALAQARRWDEAAGVLHQLRRRAPMWLRYQVYARRILADLLHAYPRTIPPDLRGLAGWLRVDN